VIEKRPIGSALPHDLRHRPNAEETQAWAESEGRRAERLRADERASKLEMCRHLERVYARRSEVWRRQGDALEVNNKNGG